MKSVLSTVVLVLVFMGCQVINAQKVILDADTANEMDDFYAIVKAIIDPEIDLIALNSAHFNNTQMLLDESWSGNPLKTLNSVELSQAYNEELLKRLDRTDISHPVGCDRILGYVWGYYPSAPIPSSPATLKIIEEARKASPENKLSVICIGASTNLAAALEKEPELAKNVHAYLLGAQFFEETNTWNKNEFNVQRDLNAFDALLNREDLEITIMPITPVRPFVFTKEKTLARLYAMHHPVAELLGDIWVKINAGEERVMWDLALIIAIQKPHLAKIELRPGPPENRKSKIEVFTEINTQAMAADFWSSLERYIERAKKS